MLVKTTDNLSTRSLDGMSLLTRWVNVEPLTLPLFASEDNCGSLLFAFFDVSPDPVVL
jgi:hypothetical protein